MKFSMHREFDGTLKFEGEISEHEIVHLPLDAFDRALIGESCETAADCLLALERMLFRRHEQQS